MGSTSVRLQRKGKGGCGLNPVLGICLWVSEYGSVKLFLVGALLWLSGDCW